MYTPRRFDETRIEVMHALIDAHPLGALVRQGENGFDADHIPFEISAPAADAPYGVLRAHVARANPLWRAAGAKVMVLFRGPSAYVSPEFFEAKARPAKWCRPGTTRWYMRTARCVCARSRNGCCPCSNG